MKLNDLKGEQIKDEKFAGDKFGEINLKFTSLRQLQRV